FSAKQMWVATSDPHIDAVLSTYPEGTDWWLIGCVVPDPDWGPWGFTFDPDSLALARITIELIQTTIGQIADDPDAFAAAGHPWAIGLHAVRERVPAESSPKQGAWNHSQRVRKATGGMLSRP